jgi:hypothetical protein
VSGQYHVPAALNTGNNPGTHGIEECVGPQTDCSLDLSGVRTLDRAVRSLVTMLSQLLKFHTKKPLRKIRDKINRVHMKDIRACCVITKQKAIRMAARTESVF